MSHTMTEEQELEELEQGNEMDTGARKRQKQPFAIAMGRRMRHARIRLEMEQQAVADALGITLEAYGSYERGWHPVPSELLAPLACVLHLTVNDLLGLPDEAGLTHEERQVIELYRDIKSPDIRKVIIELIQVHRRVDQGLRTPGPA